MSILHIVNKSPFERNALQSCLRLARPDSAIVLIEDAVYAAQQGTAFAEQVDSALTRFRVYALQPDLQARGLGEERVIDGITLVDYDGFVDLTTQYDKAQSWL